jgi:hypothetical protein
VRSGRCSDRHRSHRSKAMHSSLQTVLKLISGDSRDELEQQSAVTSTLLPFVLSGALAIPPTQYYPPEIASKTCKPCFAFGARPPDSCRKRPDYCVPLVDRCSSLRVSQQDAREHRKKPRQTSLSCFGSRPPVMESVIRLAWHDASTYDDVRSLLPRVARPLHRAPHIYTASL